MADETHPTDKVVVNNDYGTTIIIKPGADGVDHATLTSAGPNHENLSYSGDIPAEPLLHPRELLGRMRGGTPDAPHEWCSIPLTKRQIGIALGLPDKPKIAESVKALCKSAGILIKPTKEGKHPKLWYVALDTLRGSRLERFLKYTNI